MEKEEVCKSEISKREKPREIPKSLFVELIYIKNRDRYVDVTEIMFNFVV